MAKPFLPLLVSPAALLVPSQLRKPELLRPR
uniref:Uncharacterized protein n=1 Tax=Arundo donax TaxID=35708 RepID=A0A0A8YSY6_ARUDO